MIEAVIFDLDGTLVQTEQLKARSYARAAIELCPGDIEEEAVIEAYKEVVGRSRRDVAEALMQAFDLEPAATKRADVQGEGLAPWEALVEVRFGYYHDLIRDAEVVRAHRCTHALELLAEVQQSGRAVGLATTSERRKAGEVLEALGLTGAFGAVATADDVERTKPDPEAYHVVAGQLGAPPERCLAIEDSPAGVEAALAAGARCVAVPNEFTREALSEAGPIDPRFVAEDPADLPAKAHALLEGAWPPAERA